jgi:hypothetical protein
VIAQQASHGTLRSKGPGIATMPEVHEACGLDVDQMYAVLQVLREARLIQMEGEYPFEEISLTDEGGDAAKMAVEDSAAELRLGLPQ